MGLLAKAEKLRMRIPLKLTAMLFTFCITICGVVYAFKFRDTTITVVGMGIIGGVIGANVACDIKDRK